MMDGSGWGAGMAAGLFLVTALLFVLAVGLIAVALAHPAATPERRLRPPPEASLRERYAAGALTRRQYRDSLVDLVQERYVRGEIGLDEYETALSRLLQDPLGRAPILGHQEHGSA